MKKAVFTILLTAAFIIAIMTAHYRYPQIPESGKTDRLEINYGAPKLVIPPDVVVTNTIVIENVLSVLRRLPHNHWHGNRIVLPETKVTLAFNDGSNTLLVVWLSTDSIGARQGNQQYKDNRWCEVPRETLAQIVKPLGIDPQR